MKKIIILIVAVIVLMGGYFLLKGNVQAPTSNKNNQQTGELLDKVEGSSTMEERSTYEVIYTDNGYSLSELKIKVGDTIVFKNQSASGMWTASAMHPSHMVYGGTSMQEHCPDAENDNFDECKSSQPGESWSFTFKKAGNWGYHNHVKANHWGRVIVE